MDLINILNTNGTGLLHGLCRPTNYNSFCDVIKDGKKRKDGRLENFDIDFSLNENYLGRFNFQPDEPVGSTLVGWIFEKKIFIDIDWSDLEEFGRFKAIVLRP